MRIITIPLIAVPSFHTLCLNQVGELRSDFGLTQRAWGKRDFCGGEWEVRVMTTDEVRRACQEGESGHLYALRARRDYQWPRRATANQFAQAL